MLAPTHKSDLQLMLFKNGPSPGIFFVYFRLFKQQYNFYNCEKCTSSLRRWDSNPRPLEHEFHPVTTRPGLPPAATSVTRKKIAKCLEKLPKSDFTRKMNDFDTFTKIA